MRWADDMCGIRGIHGIHGMRAMFGVWFVCKKYCYGMDTYVWYCRESGASYGKLGQLGWVGWVRWTEKADFGRQQGVCANMRSNPSPQTCDGLLEKAARGRSCRSARAAHLAVQ